MVKPFSMLSLTGCAGALLTCALCVTNVQVSLTKYVATPQTLSIRINKLNAKLEYKVQKSRSYLLQYFDRPK